MHRRSRGGTTALRSQAPALPSRIGEPVSKLLSKSKSVIFSTGTDDTPVFVPTGATGSLDFLSVPEAEDRASIGSHAPPGHQVRTLLALAQLGPTASASAKSDD